LGTKDVISVTGGGWSCPKDGGATCSTTKNKSCYSNGTGGYNYITYTGEAMASCGPAENNYVSCTTKTPQLCGTTYSCYYSTCLSCTSITSTVPTDCDFQLPTP
jgi:hypothetical protein